MRIPNCDKAKITNNKIVEYLFSPSHPIGRHKVAFFRKYGFGPTSAGFMIEQLKEVILNNDFTNEINTPYGKKYIITGLIRTPLNEELELTTVWFIEKGEDTPYFVTAYPKGK